MEILKVNGVTFRNPTVLGFEYYNLSKSGRLASGKATMDIIAQKHKFTCVYETISGTDFQRMLDLVFSKEAPFYTLDVYKDNKWAAYTVYTGDISKTLVRAGSEWYYKDVSINFIEQ